MGFEATMRTGDDRSRARVRRGLGVCLAATALSLALAPGAHAAKAVTVSCGETITADTKLANDLTDCPGNGIVIRADDITLDLNGHTIDGDGIPVEGCPDDELCDVGVVNSANEDGRPVVGGGGHDGVTIVNGSIQEFVEGGVTAIEVSDNRLRGLTLSDNTWGVVFCAAAHSRIGNTTAKANGVGVVLECSGSRDIRVEHNSLSENAFLGVFAAEVQDVRIEHNTVAENEGFAGIYVPGADHVQVSSNSVSHNAEIGIVLEADDSRVSNNDLSYNPTGISVFGSRNTITGNQVSDTLGCPNGCGEGISLEGGEGNLIAQNRVDRALSDGIRIAAFVPDTPTVANVVTDNRVRDATIDGFSIATAGDGTVSDTLLKQNSAIGSGDDGFDVRSAATSLTSNTANHNYDLGIEAVPGVTDGGGNKASGNGNPLQCTNVFCK